MDVLFSGDVTVPEMTSAAALAGLNNHASLALTKDITDYSVIQVLGYTLATSSGTEDDRFALAWLPTVTSIIPTSYSNEPFMRLVQDGAASPTFGDTSQAGIRYPVFSPRVWRSAVRTLRAVNVLINANMQGQYDTHLTTVLGVARA